MMRRGRKVSEPGPQPERSGSVGCGERIAWARRRRGISLAQLSRAAGYSRDTLSYYERGHYQSGPPVKLVEDLAKALGVRRSWLAFGVGAAERTRLVQEGGR